MKPNLQPGDEFQWRSANPRVLLLACGALAREVIAVIEAGQLPGFALQCLPAKWHNTPQHIVPALREKIREARGSFEKIFVLYGDCGTGGLLDAMLAEEGVERIAGPHCYSFFSGNDAFAAQGDADLRAFFLTDYLARHFDKLIWQGLGLDQHPELRDDYFGNYQKLVYLAQTRDDALAEAARQAALRLSLAFEERFTGYGDLGKAVTDINPAARKPL